MAKKKLYKVLVDGKSKNGGDLSWSLPTKNGRKWTPGEWHSVDGDIRICHNGLHLTTEPFKWYGWGCTCYEAEARDIVEWEGDKCVARSVRLLKEVSHPKWWIDCQGWVATLQNISWLKPDGKPKSEWKVFPNRDAALDAALDVALDAAKDAALDAAKDAAWDAAWDAAKDAARTAAWNAVGDAVWDAVRDTAGDAAWTAALYACTEFICDGLKLESKHRTHVKKRMEVWQKGYGLLCDVNGVLYVYEKL